MSAQAPELPNRSGQVEGTLRLARELEPVECRSEVVVFGFEPIQPLLGGRPEDARLRFLRQRREEPSVSRANVVRAARSLETLERILADRLQHREPIIGATKEALVDE